MATGFRDSSGVDLDSLFAVYSSGTKRANTGFMTSDGVDISNRFQPGDAGITTGFRDSAGTDVGRLFAAAAAGSSLTATPTSVSVTGPRGTTLSDTVTIGNTNGTHTGAWADGGTGISVSVSGNNYTFSSTTASGSATITRSGTYRVSESGKTSVDIPVYFEHQGDGSTA